MFLPKLLRSTILFRHLSAIIFYLMLFTSHTLSAGLSLQNAEVIALQKDVSHLIPKQKALALDEQAIADGQLTDPKLKLGLMNFPIDTFDRDQEPMTQLQFGIQQAFPAGDSLKYKSARTQKLADVERSKAKLEMLNVTRSVRLFWLETYYWVQAADVVAKSRSLFDQLVSISRSRYAAGGRNQQDVIQAELELEKLADRELKIQSMQEQNRVSLARWIGFDKIAQADFLSLPTLSNAKTLEEITNILQRHPAISQEQEKVIAGQEAVKLAREAYKSKWMLDVTYGDRTGQNPNGSDREDFLSAMVILNLPLFTENRQDRQLASSEHKVTAAQKMRDSRYQEMEGELQREYTNWLHLGERIELYQNHILPSTKENVEATLKAYQNRRADFTNLAKARLAVLNTELDLLRLIADKMKSQAKLLYLQADGLVEGEQG